MSDQDIKILAIGIVWFVIGCIAGFLIGKTVKIKEQKKMTVSIKLMGGLGNTLLQIMALLGYCLKHKYDYCIPSVIDNPHYEKQKVFFSKNLKYCSSPFPNEGAWTYHEPFFHFQDIPDFKNTSSPSNLLLIGYFQSFRYWYDYLPQIKKLLGFDCKMKHSYTCAIHVRRGDYLNLPSIHPTITTEYLQQAINMLCSITGDFKWIFKFYSDDIEWCKNVAHNKFYKVNYQWEFSEGKTEEEDFRDMLGCRHFIISNSSFSLLAAILSESPDKVVFAPKKWFGENLNHDTRDLLLPEFILI